MYTVQFSLKWYIYRWDVTTCIMIHNTCNFYMWNFYNATYNIINTDDYKYWLTKQYMYTVYNTCIIYMKLTTDSSPSSESSIHIEGIEVSIKLKKPPNVSCNLLASLSLLNWTKTFTSPWTSSERKDLLIPVHLNEAQWALTQDNEVNLLL